MRAWFLVISAGFVFGIPPWGVMLLSVLAAAVSIGRIALGVHYPLDVISGAGLGILTASIAQNLALLYSPLWSLP
jgi:membrane-associated phospholipid phosphatase